MRSVLSTNLLTCNFFRSICGQFLRSQGSATFFRSMCSHFSQVSEYLCGSFQYNKDSNSKDIMAGKTKDMSDVRKVLQLHEQKVSNRKVAKQLGLDKNTVNRYIATLSNLNMKVSDLLRMEDPELEKMFFSGSPAYTDERMDTFLEELPYYRDQLKDKHVTRLLLYEEYKARHPEGYGKSQFFYHLSQNLVAQKGPTAVLTYTYDPGTYLFVDFAGDKLSYIDPGTGEIVEVEVFVACLPYSCYEYAVCVPSQKMEDFFHAIRMCLEHIGGVPKIVVSDNLKAAVIKADKYDPQINKAFSDMGCFYGFVPMPCEPHSPTQKALVESAVRRVYHHVHAKLRNRTFTSILELNKAVGKLMRKHNQTRMQTRQYSREERFFSKEKGLLKPLPDGDYETKYYQRHKVGYNNFVIVGPDKRNYSAPCQYIGKMADIIYTRSIVKIYVDGKLVATHSRSYNKRYVYEEEHLASYNREIMLREPVRFHERAVRISKACGEYVDSMFEHARQNSQPVELYYNTCQGVINLRRSIHWDIYDETCRQCRENGIYSVRRFERVAKTVAVTLPTDAATEELEAPVPTNHENMRGASQYQ